MPSTLPESGYCVAPVFRMQGCLRQRTKTQQTETLATIMITHHVLPVALTFVAIKIRQDSKGTVLRHA